MAQAGLDQINKNAKAQAQDAHGGRTTTHSFIHRH